MSVDHLPPTIYNFGAQNESAFAELAIFDFLHKRHPGKKLDVAVVASCGTHCLTVASHPATGSVDAVDVVRSQILLSELVITAGRTLPLADFEILLGNSGTGAERLAVLDRVAPLLSAEAAAYWAQNKNTVEAGLVACGGAERSYAFVRNNLPSLEIKDIAAHPDALDKAITGAFSYETVKKYLVGFPDALLQMLTKDGHLSKAFSRQLGGQIQRIASGDAHVDYIMHFVLRGRFPSHLHPAQSHYGATPPPFLDEAVLARARHRAAEVPVRYFEGPIQVVLEKEVSASRHGKLYDVIDISNILDMGDRAKQEATLKGLLPALAPGGIVIARWTSTTAPHLKEVLFPAAGLSYDQELSAAARVAETSFVAAEIAVGVKPQ